MTPALAPSLRALFAYPGYLARDVAEFLRTAVRYYRNRAFRRADLRCLLAYLIRSPDAMCQRYLRPFPRDRVQKIYGETFFSTLDAIAKAVQLTENDVVYDLGCGRGRGVFWLNAMYRCKAIGVEILPEFVIQARIIKKRIGADGVEFIYANVMDLDYRDATVIYLYGTAFTDNAIAELAGRFSTLAPGTRVVTVSYPLTQYAGAAMFALEQTMTGRYLWGNTEIYVHRKL
jgi:SAM-dependent methyltransferase